MMKEEFVAVVIAEYPREVASQLFQDAKCERGGKITCVYCVPDVSFIEEINGLLYLWHVVVRIGHNPYEHVFSFKEL
jgi:hypothetical protein